MMRRFGIGVRRGWLLAAFVSAADASIASAQTGCPPSATVASRAWPAPLDRTVAVRARDVSLRDGLDRVAAAGRFRISYSADLIPVDKHVCVSTDSVIVGEALLQLLAGSGVEAVSTGPDQVVLTPKQSERPAEPLTAVVQTLDRVVVTGSATGNAQRPLSVALDVIDGRKLSERAATTMSQTIDAGVPGLWVWEQSPTNLLAKYGSIRGASSFGLSYPKVYVDGIEVANPSLVVAMNPSSVDHIEIIRGPQGAALYGADAISGVVNIVTRNDGTQSGAERAEVTTGAGLSQTSFTPKSVLTQNHAMTLRGGSNLRSGSVTVNGTTLGDYVPDAFSRDLKINGSARAVTSFASITGTGRFYGKQAAIGENPLVKGFSSVGTTRRGGSGGGVLFNTAPSPMAGFADSLPESMREYTVGGTATFFTTGRWAPSIVAGLDGYRLKNVPNDFEPVSAILDTSLRANQSGADRGSTRVSIVGQFGDSSRQLALTFAGEQSALREVLPSSGGLDSIVWRSNTGAITQANLSLDSLVYLTGGLRLERNDGFTSSGQTEVLPMIGLAVVRDYEGGNALKMRLAYGKGIRPVQTTLHALEAEAHDRYRIPGPTTPLQPEEQSGTELGVDLLLHSGLSFHLTRFDQTAYNLIQAVMLPRSGGGGGGSGSGYPPQFQYTFQNVGQIANSGWEYESSFDAGPLSVNGSLTRVDSRVLQIARLYVGDLRVGDRMLGVPATTTGLTIAWRAPHWYLNAGVSRASDWINYDQLKLAQDFTNTALTPDDIVRNLRTNYWMHYDGVTRLRASASRDLTSTLSLSLSGDNLSNVQRGEPDNITVLPGRTFLLGLTARIR